MFISATQVRVLLRRPDRAGRYSGLCRRVRAKRSGLAGQDRFPGLKEGNLYGYKQPITGVLVAMAVAAFFSFTPAASASVIGHLDLTNCSGGGVVVTATTIDWTPPVGPPGGCTVTGTNTNVTFSGGTLGPGQTGTILDLNAMTTTFPLANFITFTSAPGLHFDLSSLGPGPASTACSTTLNPNNPSCAAVTGSPFVLTPTSTGTAVALTAMGTVGDGSGVASNWMGAFTTQIAGVTPAQIQAAILSGGSERSTYSGDFNISTVSTVPEPATSALLLGGLMAVAAFARRRKAL